MFFFFYIQYFILYIQILYAFFLQMSQYMQNINAWTFGQVMFEYNLFPKQNIKSIKSFCRHIIEAM